MTTVTEGLAEAGGDAVRYVEAGAGEPLVTVGGAGGAAITRELGLLAAGFRVIAADLPGVPGAGLDDLAGTVAAVAAGLGLERYHLLGTSLGGAVALHVALRFPERVTSLVLAAPAHPDLGAVAERMTACPVRTLVLFGTRDDVIPPENGRDYRRLLPSCSLQYVYDAGHAIGQDRAEAFADVTGDFLRRGMHFLIREQDTLINP